MHPGRTEIDEYDVDVPPGDVLRWIREDTARTSPRLRIRAAKSCRVERDLEQQAPDISDEEDELELVTVTGLLEVRPQEDAGWTLQIRAEDTLAVAEIGGEHAYEDDDDMSVEAFVADFLLPEKGEVEITVAAADAGAKARFERWLAGRRRGAQRYGTAS